MSAFDPFARGGPNPAGLASMNLAAIDMAEVTRLTRAGRLAEAVALLQGRAAAEPPVSEPTPSPHGAGHALEGAVDLEAPAEPGGAWTVAGDGPARAAAAPSGPPEMPEALRTLMQKAGQAGGLAELLRSGGLGAGMEAKLGADLGATLKAGLGRALGRASGQASATASGRAAPFRCRRAPGSRSGASRARPAA